MLTELNLSRSRGTGPSHSMVVLTARVFRAAILDFLKCTKARTDTGTEQLCFIIGSGVVACTTDFGFRKGAEIMQRFGKSI